MYICMHSYCNSSEPLHHYRISPMQPAGFRPEFIFIFNDAIAAKIQPTQYMITITLGSEFENALKIELYNTVKRSQEDLLRRIPTLESIAVTVRKTSAINFSAITGISSGFQLSPDEKKLSVNLEYRFNPEAEKIINAWPLVLSKIKNAYD